MRYYIDTEFIEDGHTVEPISLAMVREDGREFYLEFQHDHLEPNDFVREHVLPHLSWAPAIRLEPRGRQARGEILHAIGEDPHPEFWAYYADYDWIVLCQCFGRMIDLPKHFPMLCLDVQQEYLRLGKPKHLRPPKPKQAHNALADAIWTREFHEALIGYERNIRGHRA